MFIQVSPATWWGIGAAFPAITLEYLYRILPGSYWSSLLYYMPLQIVISYCVYNLVNQPDTSLIDAFVVWSASTIILRVFVSLIILHDKVTTGTWMALVLLLSARLAQGYFGR